MDLHVALALLRESESSRPASPASPPPPEPPLRGRALRFVLVDEMLRRHDMTVAEMVHVLVEQYGFDLGGRASKVISDALRWEVRRGRVVRLSRGRYRFARATRSTVRRVRLLAGYSRAWVVARRRSRKVPTAPYPHRRTADPHWNYHPEAAPWANLAWLRDR
ncbi:MAG: hypothetical protein R2761_27450 [Acidimicrobiales bacterium]